MTRGKSKFRQLNLGDRALLTYLVYVIPIILNQYYATENIVMYFEASRV